jgi:RNA polymerase sigma-54 factor
MLEQSLGQKLLQKLSPQQIQLMKLLQIPTAALEQRIKQELEENPALEEGTEGVEEEMTISIEETREKEEENNNNDDLDLSDYIGDDTGYEGGSYNKDEEETSLPIAVVNTFHDKLIEQMGMLDLTEKEYIIAEQLIGSIDDDGYLRRELRAIVNDMAFTQNIITNEAEVEKVLLEVQKFDPAGVAARNLQECLLIQITRKAVEEKPALIIANQILNDYYEAFTKKHYDKLIKQLNISEPELKDAIDEILKLNPKPGGSLDSIHTVNQYIIPDFTVVNNNNKLELSLNSRNAPDLKVSEGYKEMMTAYMRGEKEDKKQKEAVMFIKQKLDSAKWFIDAIKQRQNTLLLTMNAILAYQHEYFLTGDETKLRPMILKDIADITGLDISTVSRVANSKYVATEFGTIFIKTLFSESLQTDSGEEVSTREVKKILSDLIEAEEKSNPLSDQQLSEFLNQKGYNIARRTVAKYREQLNIPVARLRKEL